MKGAIGNAFLLNIVITLILIFYSLLISSVAFTKAYKIKNHIINSVDTYFETYHESLKASYDFKKLNNWHEIVNPYLGKVGYQLNSPTSCPNKSDYGYTQITNNKQNYNYCLYNKIVEKNVDYRKERYLVVVYMQFDFPIIGSYLKVPITGETKTYTVYY